MAPDAAELGSLAEQTVETEERTHDVQEPLDAAISVISVNVQHLESLNDVVESPIVQPIA